MAAVRPAAPPPMITTSYCSVFLFNVRIPAFLCGERLKVWWLEIK